MLLLHYRQSRAISPVEEAVSSSAVSSYRALSTGSTGERRSGCPAISAMGRPAGEKAHGGGFEGVFVDTEMIDEVCLENERSSQRMLAK